MDSTGERNPAGANNRERGESVIESGITVLMSRREEEHVMSMQQRHRDDDESDEVIDVGSDSEEDGGVRDEKRSTTLDAMASFLPYSGHGACGEKVNDRSVEMQEREAAATLVDPSVAAQGSTEVGSGEDRQSIVTALRAHFRDEEEEEEGDVEEGVTKTYVRNKSNPFRTPDLTGKATLAPDSGNGDYASGGTTTTPRRPPSPNPGAAPKENAGEKTGRTSLPNYGLWKLASLKEECARLGKRRQGLKYGPLPNEVLRNTSNANKDECVNALLKRTEWLATLGEIAEWVSTPIGITPEKAPKRRRVTTSTSAQGLGRGMRTTESCCCRLVCLTLRPPLWDLYVASMGGSSRAEVDANETGYRQKFYVEVAKAMMDEDWTDINGNFISVPDDHHNDERAPEILKKALNELDLRGPALSLQRELEEAWKGEKDHFMLDLQRRCSDWLKEIKKYHTDFLHKQGLSGGVGADSTPRGETVDAIHPFQFMGGRLATMLWEDGILLNAADDGTCVVGEVVIPDSSESSGSSIPGGPGVRSTSERRRPTAADNGVDVRNTSPPLTPATLSSVDSKYAVHDTVHLEERDSTPTVTKTATSAKSKREKGGSNFDPMAMMAKIEKWLDTEMSQSATFEQAMSPPTVAQPGKARPATPPPQVPDRRQLTQLMKEACELQEMIDKCQNPDLVSELKELLENARGEYAQAKKMLAHKNGTSSPHPTTSSNAVGGISDGAISAADFMTNRGATGGRSSRSVAARAPTSRNGRGNQDVAQSGATAQAQDVKGGSVRFIAVNMNTVVNQGQTGFPGTESRDAQG